jgi:hypothetical protein
MTILSEIYNAFDPAPLPANSKLYVDCKAVRGNSDITIELGRTILYSNNPTCQLFTGHRGSGKSTELLRLKQDLESKGCTVVYFSAEDEDISVVDVEYTDLLLTFTRHLLQNVKVADPKPLHDWLRERGQELKDILLTDISVMEPNVGIDAQEFGKITASIRTQPKQRSTLREVLTPYTENLVNALNEFIADAKQKLPQDKQRLVVIVDGLDKLTPTTKSGGRTNLEEIFIDRGEQMQGLLCDVIYTVPISLVLSSRASDLIEIYSSAPYVLPMVMVQTQRNEIYIPGIEVLKSIIGSRIWSVEEAKGLSLEHKVFDSAETLDYLCLMSGGHVRNLVLLMQTAIKYNEEESLPIQANALQQAIRQLRKTYRDTVNDDQWELLAAVHISKQILNDDAHRSLLFTRCLLEYRADEAWHDVHPVLMGVPEFKAALEKQQSRWL